MKVSPHFTISGLLLVVIVSAPFYAQTGTTPPSDAKATSTAPSGQAPDEATKKITDLVHAGKYAEAQQLTNGLLIAYPDDQRLIKAKALIDKLLAPTGSTVATTTTSQPGANASAAQLTGMDKVDYNALIELARQAQQTTDLDEQKKLLQQFMDQSASFLQKHPDLTLLWQFRVVSAISLNEPLLGYEAGQKLLAMGDDPALQNLLAQLRNKGWLDKQEVEKQSKLAWILGPWWWTPSFTDSQEHVRHQENDDVDFSRNGPTIEGSRIYNGKRGVILRGTILDSGEIRWDSVQSSAVTDDHRTLTLVFPAKNGSVETWVFHRED